MRETAVTNLAVRSKGFSIKKTYLELNLLNIFSFKSEDN